MSSFWEEEEEQLQEDQVEQEEEEEGSDTKKESDTKAQLSPHRGIAQQLADSGPGKHCSLN